ncbi:MAG TPA: phosphotransferase [Caulobacteraceae bacterium]|nr:phosphotransferase [Caulobacteraceae bacterium]
MRRLAIASNRPAVQVWRMTLEAAYSTISAASIAAVVDRQFKIGPAARCRLFARGFNDTYELEATDGRRYMARLCDRRFRGPANVDYETALLAHLDRCGIAVGTPVADRQGRLWSILDAPEGHREFAVFERLEGRAPFAGFLRTGKADAQTLADIQALGASLGQMHLAGASFDGPPSLYRIDGRHLIENPLAQILAVVDDPLAQELTAVGESLRAQLTERAPSLSIGHCHGDNHAGNTLIADSANGAPIPGWFDFDDAAPGFLAYDLATFLWSGLFHARSDTLSEASRPTWTAFVTGYRSVRPIPAGDFDAIGLLVAIRHVNFMGQYASRIPEWGVGFVSSDWFRNGLGLVHKWDSLAAPAVD